MKNRANIKYIEGGDCACRIARDKLKLHLYPSKQILVLGLEPCAAGSVQRESKKLSIVEYLRPFIAPFDVNIFVKGTCRNSYEKGSHKRDDE